MINIRNASHEDILGIATVHVKTWQTAYASILPVEYLQNMSTQKSVENWERSFKNNDSINLVAECHDKGVIGFISVGANREKSNYPSYDAEIYAIYILKSYEKQGIGTLLFKEATKQLLANGYNNIIIWMLKGNSSEMFYKKMSGQIIGEKSLKIGGKDYPVVAFGIQNANKIFDC